MSDKDKIYYDGTKLISYGKFISFLTSPRAGGKSYFFKRYMTRIAVRSIKKVLDKNTGEVDESKIKTFTLIRRFQSECNSLNIANFFTDIAHEFPDCEFKTRGKEFLCKVNGCKNFVKIGEALCLTKAVTYKSRNFDTVAVTLWEECFINAPNHRMLTNEAHTYLDLLSTICRLRKVRNFCIGNNNCIEKCELLHMFGIRINPANLQAGFYKSNINDEVIMEVYEPNEAYKEMAESESPFIRLVQGTTYGQQNMENKSTTVSDIYLRPKKPSDSRHMAQFLIDEHKLSLWYSDKEALFYWSSLHHSEDCKKKYAVTNQNVVDYQLLRKFRSSGLCRMLKDFRDENRIYYDNAITMEKAREIMSLVGA